LSRIFSLLHALRKKSHSDPYSIRTQAVEALLTVRKDLVLTFEKFFDFKHGFEKKARRKKTFSQFLKVLNFGVR
jgi:hypothetical protein